MLIHPAAEEVLEQLWYFGELGREAANTGDFKLEMDESALSSAIADLVRAGAVSAGEKIRLLPPGEERARAIVRRHRLAEVLFAEVLEADLEDAEASACELEHALSERVVDRVCTFLGHPPKCPHGKPIPRGSCCKLFEKRVEPLIARLFDLPIGASAPIVFIAPKTAARLNRLATLGVVPGTTVKLLQKRPSVVILCGESSLAIEEEVAAEIYVRA